MILIYNKGNISINYNEKTLLNTIHENYLNNKKTIFRIIIVSLISIILGIFTSFYLKFIIDFIIPNETVGTLHVLMICLIFFNITSILIDLFRSYLLIFLNQNIEFSIFNSSISHLIDLPLSFFDSRKTGELITKITDISKIKGVIEESVLICFVDIPMSILIGFFLFYKNRALFLIALIMLFLYIFSTFFSKNSIKYNNNSVMENTSKMTSFLIEAINGMENIKAYNLQDNVKKELEKIYIKLLNSIFRMNLSYFTPATFNILVHKIGILIVTWIGSLEIIKGNLSLGEFLVFEALLGYFLNPIKNIIDFYPQIQAAKVAMNRLNDILDNSKEENINKININSLKEVISFKNVSFNYRGKKKCLENLSFTIRKGSRVAFVGESGSGKTTILKLLMRFYDIEEGEIFIGNINIKNIDLKVLRDKISYVSQNTFLFNGSIKENLEINNKISFDNIIKIIENFEGFEFIKSFPGYLHYLIEENGKNLSTGQKQRLGLLKAILKTPDIIIMDEVMSNLDAITEIKLQRTIDLLLPKSTRIMISHRLNLISDYETIFVVDRGKIIEIGDHKELINLKGKYYHLWKEQYKNYEI